jgi:chromate transporter
MVEAMKDDSVLLTLLTHFAFLSLFAIGGAYSAIPEMHRIAVEGQQWMTERQFSDFFAISQVSPGPNIIIVTLIGYHVAGIAGALVATLAMCGPTCVFAFFMTGVWDRARDARWRIATQAGLVPLSIGMMAASLYVVTGATGPGWVSMGIMAVAAIAGFSGRLNPLWIFALAGILGLTGWL